MPYDQRRKSVCAATYIAPSTRDNYTSHATNSSFYTAQPANGIFARPLNPSAIASLSISSNSPSMYPLNGNAPTSPKQSMAGPQPNLNAFSGRKSSIIPSNFGPSQNMPPVRENRKKAVITIDAQSTEVRSFYFCYRAMRLLFIDFNSER